MLLLIQTNKKIINYLLIFYNMSMYTFSITLFPEPSVNCNDAVKDVDVIQINGEYVFDKT